jgi:UDP-2,3-diacylglucosamine hydrolase
MTDRPFFVVSDIHLGAVPRTTERAFREFLAFAGERASGLMINGDLFDFWFEYRSVIMKEHFRVLASLAEVVEKGLKVWFVGGNHDAWGGSFLRDEVGLEVLSGPLEMEIAGRRTLVAHGDGVGEGDYKYRALKACIRHPALTTLFRTLHPDLGTWVADKVSTTEAKAEFSDARAEGRARYIRDWAVSRLRAEPGLDLVIAGHAHVPSVEEVAPGRFYANSGDWVHHQTYLVLGDPDQPPELRNW